MAAAGQVQNLKDEATCSICLEFFTEPVSLDCGHVFCLSCITQYVGQQDASFPCPQCRRKCKKENLRKNRQMANMVEIVKELRVPPVTPPPGALCPKHGEKLKMFCEEDQEAICVVCRESRERKPHSVAPLEEAQQEYKKKLQTQLQAMQNKLKEIRNLKSEGKKKALDLEKETKNQRKRIELEFEELHQYLTEQEHILLTRLNEYEHEIHVKLMENMSLLEEQNDYLEKLIADIEHKFKQPPIMLLTDVKNTLRRWENVKLQIPQPVRPKFKSYLQLDFPRQHFMLLKMSAAFTEKLSAKLGTISEEIEWRRARCYAVNVTLDPETANTFLTVSEDRKSVRYARTKPVVPENPKRFVDTLAVLGCEGFTSGKHYWEVDIGAKLYWTLGVCKDTVKRKKIPARSPQCGFWRIGLNDTEDQYWAGTEPPTAFNLAADPKIVGVFLDYEAGKLSFYNVDGKSHIYTFTDNFTNILRPYFGAYNSSAMRLCPVIEWE